MITSVERLYSVSIFKFYWGGWSFQFCTYVMMIVVCTACTWFTVTDDFTSITGGGLLSLPSRKSSCNRCLNKYSPRQTSISIAELSFTKSAICAVSAPISNCLVGDFKDAASTRASSYSHHLLRIKPSGCIL